MKFNLHLKTVRSLFIILVLFVTQGTILSAQVPTPAEWRSAASGDWAAGATWERNVGGVWTLQTGTAAPSGSSNVTIRSGHTVTISATKGMLGLTIEAGGKLASTTAITSPTTLRIGNSSSGDATLGYTANEVIIQNDGILGSLSDADAGIALEIDKYCKTCTIQGSGVCRIGRVRPGLPSLAQINSPVTFNINQDMYFGYASTNFTAYYSSSTGNFKEDNIVFNILAGRTVTTVGGFHGSVSSTTPLANPQGTITYNIYGTLDLTAVTSTSQGLQTTTEAGSTSPTINLNIKSGGLMKMGAKFSAYRGANKGSINMVIEDGGVVDGTLLTTGITNSNSTLGTGNTWFVTQGTGRLKLPVSTAAPMTFPIGPTSTSYNPVTMDNGGGTVFSVGVAVGNVPSGVPNVVKAVNRTWGIVPSSLPASADLTFGYNTGEGNGSCVLADPMQLNVNAGAWAALTTSTPTVPSSGATSFQVSYTGTAAFGFFNLVNVGTIPVEMTAFKGYAKGAVNILEWATASERNNREFAIERSTNGVDFQHIGSVKGNGNSSKVNNYTFADDAAPLSISYYRLRQIDFDGKETVSKAVTIARNGSGKVGITKLYPSVTSDYLNIEMTTSGKTTLTVTDLLGRTVSTQQLGDTNGTLLQRLDVSQLSNGLYFITLQSGSTSLTEKFEKQ